MKMSSSTDFEELILTEGVRPQTEVMKTKVWVMLETSTVDTEAFLIDVSSVSAESCTDTDIELKVRDVKLQCAEVDNETV